MAGKQAANYSEYSLILNECLCRVHNLASKSIPFINSSATAQCSGPRVSSCLPQALVIVETHTLGSLCISNKVTSIL